MKLKNYLHIVVTLLFVLVIVGCSNSESNTSGSTETNTNEEPKAGGTLEVAFASEPDTIDLVYTGASATRDVGWHIFEYLFALDKNFEVKPMIASEYKVNDDRTVYTISLREGVAFHDGSTVTSEDVVASIDRWKTISSVGKVAGQFIETVTAVDELTVEVTLNKPYNVLLDSMSAPKAGLMIIPAEIAKEAGEQPLNPDQLIGTGPYKFESWEKGKEIILTRFEEYAAREETDWGGLTGKKEALFDKIKLNIVKDPQVMINGIKTGLYDYAQSIPADLYQVIESSKNIEPVTYMNGYSMITPDQSEAPFNDLKVRQALNHALNKEVIAEATYGNKEFYNMDGALFDPKQTELYSEEGTDQYLVYDKEKAKSLLEESSYNGETITIMYANNYENYKRISQVVKQQLEEVGFKVELVPYEWATYLEKWADPANWDLVVIGWSTRFAPSELGMLAFGTQSSGWYESERWADLLTRWGNAVESDEKKEILGEMNQTVYDELPFVKIANETLLDIKTDKVKDYENWVGPRFWNTWKSE
ncbi:ABC transporter substrate-binding protein [Fredinandcohnia sp. 179-A 10B2 NHS]|uniref:ABC transporter substrate-binding protein n=1 Tax=Fredinandcohnia sp. 179-A 10B2 NHS TaxID=3235176 RepID=UPI0039A2C5C7